MEQRQDSGEAILKLLAGLAVLAILLILLFLPYSGKAEWLGGGGFAGVPRPPIPHFAMHLEYLGSGSLPGYRTVRFETNQPADEILQFYRTELTKRGWVAACASIQPEQEGCALGDFSPVADVRDFYERDDKPSMLHSIDLIIYKPGEQAGLLVEKNNHLVEVTEYYHPLYPHYQEAESPNLATPLPLTPGIYPWPGAERPTDSPPAYP